MGELLAEATSRETALAALREGLEDRDRCIAWRSAQLLAEQGALPPKEGARAAVRAIALGSNREAADELVGRLLAMTASRESALAALREGLEDQDRHIAWTSALLLAEQRALPPREGARAAVRTFSFGSSREAGERLMGRLLAEPSSRQAAILALRDGVADEDSDIAGTSARVLAEQGGLPPLERARAAVRAFSFDSSQEAGARVIFELLAGAASRESAMAALHEGVADEDPDITAMSAWALAQEKALPPLDAARAAVRAFSFDSSRDTWVLAMVGADFDAETRGAVLEGLREGLVDEDPDIAGTSAVLLAERGELPPKEGAQAAVRAFASDYSWEAGVRVMGGLLAEATSREAALAALHEGLADRDRSVAGTSARLLRPGSLPPQAGWGRRSGRSLPAAAGRRGRWMRRLHAEADDR